MPRHVIGGDARDEHDVAAGEGPHGRNDVLGQHHRAERVGAEEPFHLVRVGVGDAQTSARDPGVGDADREDRGDDELCAGEGVSARRFEEQGDEEREPAEHHHDGAQHEHRDRTMNRDTRNAHKAL